MLKKIFLWLNARVGKRLNPFQIRKLKKSLQKRGCETDFSIIAQNCVGGVIYHELGLKFLSPTINMYMESSDFIRFCENIRYYLSLKADTMKFVEEKNYPVAFLDDIKIYFVHYKTNEEAIKKWEERRSRVNYEKIYIIMTDRDGFNEEILARFLSLKQKKLLFSSKKIESKDVVYMPCFKKDPCVGGLTAYCNIWGKRYYCKYFDVVKWLSE